MLEQLLEVALLQPGVAVRERVAREVRVAVDDGKGLLAAHGRVKVLLGLGGGVHETRGATAGAGLEDEHGSGRVLEADDRAQSLSGMDDTLTNRKHRYLRSDGQRI